MALKGKTACLSGGRYRRRRDQVKALLVWACALFGAVWPLPLSASPAFTFVQITDLHLPGNPCEGCPEAPGTLFKQAIGEINALSPPPRFVVITGDIAAESGEEQAYRLFRDLVRELRVPVHFALGNHDRRKAFRRIVLNETDGLDRAYYYSFDCDPHHFVVLDSSLEGSLSGELSAEQLSWLDRDLQANRGRITVIFMHHHIRPLGDTEEYPLRNAHQVMGAARRHAGVQTIASGHVHFSRVLFESGIFLVNTMSLSSGYGKAPGPPGYRLVKIDEPGQFRFFDKRLSAGPVEEWVR